MSLKKDYLKVAPPPSPCVHLAERLLNTARTHTHAYICTPAEGGGGANTQQQARRSSRVIVTMSADKVIEIQKDIRVCGCLHLPLSSTHTHTHTPCIPQAKAEDYKEFMDSLATWETDIKATDSGVARKNKVCCLQQTKKYRGIQMQANTPTHTHTHTHTHTYNARTDADRGGLPSCSGHSRRGSRAEAGGREEAGRPDPEAQGPRQRPVQEGKVQRGRQGLRRRHCPRPRRQECVRAPRQPV